MKTYNFKINGNQYNVAINSVEGNQANVTVNGTSYQVELENAPSQPVTAAPAVQSAPAPKATSVQAATAPNIPNAAPASTPVSAPAPTPSAGTKSVKAPLPGVIIALKVNVGDVIKEGQAVAVLEAMKMENELESEYSGTVTAINVAKGDSVLEGTTIVTIA